VGDQDDVRLAALAPAQAVVDRRSHQQHRPDHRREQAEEERGSLEPGRATKASGERNGQQDAEKYLGAWKRNAQLGKQLDKLPVRPLLLGLEADGLLLPCMSREKTAPGFTCGLPGIECVAKSRMEVRKCCFGCCC
jgi:hypothetical protein